jgi:hypothetical protein
VHQRRRRALDALSASLSAEAQMLELKTWIRGHKTLAAFIIFALVLTLGLLFNHDL